MKIDFVVARVVETKGFTGTRINGKLDMEARDQKHRTDIYLMCHEASEVQMGPEELHLSYEGSPDHEPGQTLRLELGGVE